MSETAAPTRVSVRADAQRVVAADRANLYASVSAAASGDALVLDPVPQTTSATAGGAFRATPARVPAR